MVDVKENDQASKSNSSPKEDAAHIVLTPATVSSTSKDEGNAMVGPEIDQGHNKKKAMTEGETAEAQAVREDAARGKTEEKTNRLINGESLGGGSKAKGSKPRKRNKKKKVAQKASKMVVRDGNEGNATVAAANNGGLTIDEEHDKGKAIGEEETHEEDAVKDASMKKGAEERKNREKLGESSNGRGRKPRRNRKKKVGQKASEMVVVDGDKPESSRKKMASKKVDSMGMVFMCSSKTKADCFHYKILGLPAGKKDQVAKIYKGMRLFLFDVDLRLMYGIFKSAGAGGYNIEPKAFKSAFPSQVRFTVIEDCLPLAEEKFRIAIKENYYSRNKFGCQLNAQQVKNLCKLFVAGKSDPNPKKAIKSGANGSRKNRADAYTVRDREKRKRRAREEETRPRPPLGKERGRRYHDYGQPPVRYEQRGPLPSLVHPVARYLPPPQQDPVSVRSYGYDRTYSYARDPVLEHRSYHGLDKEPRHYDEIISHHDQERDRDRHHLYSREPPIYRDNVYPPVGQTVEYGYLPAATLPPQYRLVSREYPSSAVQAAEHHVSGGLQAHDYHDVGYTPTSGYPSSAALVPEYRGHRSRYGY